MLRRKRGFNPPVSMLVHLRDVLCSATAVLVCLVLTVCCPEEEEDRMCHIDMHSSIHLRFIQIQPFVQIAQASVKTAQLKWCEVNIKDSHTVQS